MVKEIKKDAKPSLKWQRDKDREMVRGIFRFHEVPGGSMSFVFKKYKEDPVERFDLVDGQPYTIPLGVAKHLNQNCSYPEHAFQLDDAGHQIARIRRMVPRCSFQSLEFTDIDELAPRSELVMADSLRV